MQRPGSWVAWGWWDQEGEDLADVRARAAAAVDGEEESEIEEMRR